MQTNEISVDTEVLDNEKVVQASVELTDEKRCKELLKNMMEIQPRLSPLIFDEDQKMYPNVRKALVKIASNLCFYINDIFEHIKIEDIYLVAGMAGYIYHEQSDIDVFIIIKPDENIIDKQDFEERFKHIASAFTKRKIIFKLLDRFVDTSVVANYRITGGIYSLLYDCWVQKPIKQKFNFNVDELYDECVRLDKEINHFICEMPKISPWEILSYDDAIKAVKFTDDFKNDMINLKFSNPEKEYNKTYMAYRALKKMGLLAVLFKYVRNSLSILFNEEVEKWK